MSDIATVAVDLVPQINAAHEAYKKTGEDSLTKAVEAGKLLTEAKAAVKKSSLGWLKWRERHLPKIGRSTADLYIQLYEKRHRLDANAVSSLAREGRLSIREARALVRDPPTQEQLDKRAANKVARDAENPKAAKSLEQQLRDLNDADVIAALIRRAHPDADFIATLIEALERDQPPKMDTLDIPPALDRRPQPEQIGRRI